MARLTIPSLKSDFERVVAFLQSKSILSGGPDAKVLEHAKRIHRATFSLILWRFRLTGLDQHGQVFVEEIASDAIQILPQILMGYAKTAKLLTRGVVENTLRHVYFTDHPVEFKRMNMDAKWYMAVEGLFEYLRKHPTFIDTEAKFDAINRLSTLYDELSAGVHGRRVVDFDTKTALSKITLDLDSLEKQMELTERCAAAACFLLAVFHRDKVHSFPMEDRRIILRSMPAVARTIWDGLD